ncbi:hypothetical protein [Roseobacter sinensis]|uniref:Uncharacterized protein n=1 Tax=Roseobacter sinensis TaxID=2931391 RepID=A0ABT3BJL6_9RHOB|nr:hypothetical protein [Roseobacter sp. WL0113]MCV3273299.1 hypothetical protein [Roseobacter sp. WL0113]
MALLRTLWTDLRANWKTMVVHGLIFALVFQVFMMLALILRFQAFPNYVTFYDWIGNVSWIVQSTPAWSDILPIIWEEWLIEIGKMNYDYGTGISEWSLNVVPSRLLVLFALGAMVSLCLALLRRDSCEAGASTTLRATTGFGALLVAMTNATMSWVVCCATPSWVVGLAMLGLGVSTSLALETMGPVLSGAGFGLLFALILVLAWRKCRPAPVSEGEPANA